MSIEATSWALNVPIGGNPKVILLGLANHAHPDGTDAYPSLDTLARYAHCDRSTARRNVRKLVDDGWIVPDGNGPKGQAKYRMAMGGSQNATGGAGDAGGVASAPEGGGIATPPEPSFNRPENRPESKSARASQVEEVWGHYQATMPNGQRCQLNAARKLLIQNALRVRSAEECQRAITALSRSEYHVQNGYLDLKYALLGGGRSPNPEATIDRLIGQLRNGQLRSNGNGNGQRRYFDGRPWEQLSSAEKLSAQEMISMGMDPSDPETWKGDQTPARPSSGKSFTAATILSDEVGELVGATNGNGHA